MDILNIIVLCLTITIYLGLFVMNTKLNLNENKVWWKGLGTFALYGIFFAFVLFKVII